MHYFHKGGEMTLKDIEAVLASYPGQFVAERAGTSNSVTVRSRGPEKEDEWEDVVGVYDLDNNSLNPEWVREDIESYLQTRKF